MITAQFEQLPFKHTWPHVEQFLHAVPFLPQCWSLVAPNVLHVLFSQQPAQFPGPHG